MSNQSSVGQELRNKQTNKKKKKIDLNHTKHTLPVCLGQGFPTLYTNPLSFSCHVMGAVSRIEKNQNCYCQNSFYSLIDAYRCEIGCQILNFLLYVLKYVWWFHQCNRRYSPHRKIYKLCQIAIVKELNLQQKMICQF